MYFVEGPTVKPLDHQSVQIHGKFCCVEGDPKWYVFVVESQSPMPNFLNLKQSSGSSMTDNIVIKDLNWRLKYDFYFYTVGFNEEDFVANAIYRVSPKIPSLGNAKRFDVQVLNPHDLDENNPDDFLEILVSSKHIGSGPVEVLVEPSQAGQIWISDINFLVENEKTLLVKPIYDTILEGSHSLLVYFIDFRDSLATEIEVFLVDSTSSQQTEKNFEVFQVLLGSEGTDYLQIYKDQPQFYHVRLSSPPLHPVIVQVIPDDFVEVFPRLLVFGYSDWNSLRAVEVRSLLTQGKGLIQHELRSEDIRFVFTSQLPIQVYSPKSNHEEIAEFLQSKDDSNHQTSLATTGTDCAIEVSPPVSHLVPRSSIQIFIKTATPKTLHPRLIPLHAKPESLSAIKFKPSRIETTQGSPTIIHIWCEDEFGHSFSFLFSFDEDPVSIVIHVVSRIPAISS